MIWFRSAVLSTALLTVLTEAACPFKNSMGSVSTAAFSDVGSAGDGGVPEGGYEAVTKELKELFTTSQDTWPADFNHYGPFMIRLAWHCAGSYRISDGRGGCDGGRIRFNPELDWPDNGNLNMALKLLEPIKQKYGCKLSWGDLIVLAGNAAIESMGGPVLGFCGGRIDDGSGAHSLKLGPTEEQEKIAPCQVNGECESPLGPTTVGLIYVNPGGHLDNPVPEGSVIDIRDSFGRMDMNDTETVALIGGGHAFGKMHGACSERPCGNGTDLQDKGPNTVTSGFEGVWTTRPTEWSNEYFSNLLQFTWQLDSSPAGKNQWIPAEDGAPDIVMLTSDLALKTDETYRKLVEEWSADIKELEKHFQHAWYKLMTRDMGPITRCLGNEVPPAQPFQMPLPKSDAANLPDYVAPSTKIQAMLKDNSELTGQFVSLAFQCASTYRHTDHLGGCNGARIRFSPEADWPSNAGAGDTLTALQPVKDQFSEVSWSDLIVLAGHVAVENAGGHPMQFCGGRVDAQDGTGSEFLAPRLYSPAVVSVRDDMEVKGLSPREMVALFGRPSGTGKVSNEFFQLLLEAEFDTLANEDIFRADPDTTFTSEQAAIVQDPEFKVIVEEYAANEDVFKKEFKAAWTKMMTTDRFDGPASNLCDNRDDPIYTEQYSTEKQMGTKSDAHQLHQLTFIITSFFIMGSFFWF